MGVRLIQVGMGGWGRNWASNVIPNVPSASVVGWVDTGEENLLQARKALGLPAERCFGSIEDALSSVEADAVLITTFLEGHAPVALTALKAGKHVLVEKPFAESIATAARVVEAARRRKRVLMVSQNYRFHPAPVAVRKLVEKGTLGPVGTVHIDFRRYANTAPATHRHYAIWHPLLADMSIHHFDLMRMVLGQNPTRVECRTWHPPWSRFKNPPAGAATIDFDGGAVVSYRGSWVSTDTPTPWAGEWRMECEKGVIEWSSRGGDEADTVRICRPGKPSRSLALPKRFRRDRAGALTAFVRAVETGAPVETSGRDNLQTLALMLAAIESADTGKPVSIRGKG